MVIVKQQTTRSIQNRSIISRQRIAEGAITVLAQSGVNRLTHRSVAKAAKSSLAATTRHFDTKLDILWAASTLIFDSYLISFERLNERLRAGQKPSIRSLDDLVSVVVLNSLNHDRDRDRTHSLAWFEVIFHSGRTPSGRALTQDWFVKFDGIWQRIAEWLEPGLTTEHVTVALDRAVGLALLLHPLGLPRPALSDVLNGRIGIEQAITKLAKDHAPDAASEATARSGQNEDTRKRIVQAAIDLLVEQGASAVSYRAVAERCGMVRSGPTYYFATISSLLETAEMALFARAKARYREGLGAAGSSEISESRLADLSTAIFFREVLEFPHENLGFYSVWLSASQNSALLSTVAASFLNQYAAWRRRLGIISDRSLDPRAPLYMQATYLGGLIRAVATGADVADLSKARERFCIAIRNALEIGDPRAAKADMEPSEAEPAPQ